MRRKPVFFYGWVIVFVAFVVVFLGAGTRTTFGVFFKPMLDQFGWDRASVSLAVSLNVLLYGITQPLVGKLVDRFGARRVIIVSTVTMGIGTVLMAGISSLWQLYITFGIIAAIGGGGLAFITSSVLVANWFNARRGLALGISQAGSPAGQLILIPLAMYLILTVGWRMSYAILGIAFIAILLPVTFFLVKNQPADVGMHPYGAEPTGSTPGGSSGPTAPERRTGLLEAMRTTPFWQLAFGFFVCGFTVNLVTTHLVAFAVDNKIPEMDGANALGLMGGLNVVGTMLVGALTDKLGKKNPLAFIYFTRGLAFLLILGTTNVTMLYLFAAVFGFAYLATVPPTSGLSADLYGRASMGVIFGTVTLSHQIGGAIGAWLAGWFFDSTGTYFYAFVLGAITCFAAAAASYTIKEKRAPQAAMASR